MHEKYTQLPLDLRTKRCTKCLRELPFDAFIRHPRGAFGLHPRCKACRNIEHAAYYSANRDRLLAKEQLQREKRRDQLFRWRAKNPERSVAHEARRRASRAAAAINDFTAEQWQASKEYFNGHCAYCGEPCEALTQEHMIPLSRGGNHTAANIVPACRWCNSRKHDRTLMEYLMR
jgi:5-methylcytosine-specific restriction endonuclease McrA